MLLFASKMITGRHEFTRVFRFPRRMTGLTTHDKVRLGKTLRQIKGRFERTDDIVPAMGKHRRDVSYFVNIVQNIIRFGQPPQIHKIMRFDPCKGGRKFRIVSLFNIGDFRLQIGCTHFPRRPILGRFVPDFGIVRR